MNITNPKAITSILISVLLLANQAAKKSSADAPRVVIDVEGVSDDREDSLRELAERALKSLCPENSSLSPS